MKELAIFDKDPEILRKASLPVLEFGDALNHVIDDMTWVMRTLTGNGLGISAVQVKEHLRMGILELNYGRKNLGKPFVMINPEIVEIGNATLTVSEGCLSFPRKFVDIERPTFVRIKYQDQQGQPQLKSFINIWARCVLHEMDHMNGSLIIDKLPKEKNDL